LIKSVFEAASLYLVEFLIERKVCSHLLDKRVSENTPIFENIETYLRFSH